MLLTNNPTTAIQSEVLEISSILIFDMNKARDASKNEKKCF